VNVKTGTLVLVADGRKMRLLKNTGTANNVKLTVLLEREEENPPSREHGSDRPGRTHSSTGEHRSSYSETNWHDQAEIDFALQTAADLEALAEKNPTSAIIVIADARTLGAMRGHYGRSASASILAELDRDLVNHSDIEVAKVVASEAEMGFNSAH
jgi:protein required for attachment to host cells